MADPKLTVKTLGHSGVIIDQNPLEESVPVDALRNAQNATHDPTAGFGGALRKRPGLVQFNQIPLGGPVLGGIPMAVVGTGGAPVSGGGGLTADPNSPNQAAGTGNQTGAPGGSSNPNPQTGGATYPSQAASLLPGPGGSRLIVIGRDDNTHTSGSVGTGWYIGDAKLADSSAVVTTPGPPGCVYSYPPTSLFPAAYGVPGAFYLPTGFYYYAASHVQNGATPALSTIRKTNGAVDSLVCTIPLNASSTADVHPPSTDKTQRQAITAIHSGADGYLYIAVKDKADGQAVSGNVGRLFAMDPNAGALIEINTGTIPQTPGSPAAVFAHLPFAINHFHNRLYYSCFDLSSSELQEDTPGVVFATVTDPKASSTYSIQDLGYANGEAITCMLGYPISDPSPFLNRRLICGTGVNKATPKYAYLLMRDRSAPGLGVYTAVLQASDSGTAQAGNYWVSVAEFNGAIYASHYNPTQSARIWKATPTLTSLAADGGWDGTTSAWSAVFTNAGAGDRVPYVFYVDPPVVNSPPGTNSGQILYAVGSLGLGGAMHALWTSDGVTWNDASAKLPAGSNQSFPLPLMWGVNQ